MRRLGLDRCKKCGECCHLCTFVDGKYVRLKRYVCPFLSKKNLCRIYPARQQVRGCLTITDTFDRAILPVGCGYGGGKARMVGGECNDDGKRLVTPEGREYVKINA